MQTSYRITVHGRVQGVFYRQSTVKKALEMGITGTVKNCSDGSVEIIAVGLEPQLKSFVDWCRRGPDRARVDRLDMHEHPLKNYTGFVITY